MKYYIWQILTLSIYCFPYIFVAMYVDYTYWTMLGYALFIVPVIVAYRSRRAFGISVLVTGNLLSFLVSYYFIVQMTGNEMWDVYFTPLSPVQLLILVSVIHLVPQCIAHWIGPDQVGRNLGKKGTV